jgi:hypothetical protein
MYLHTKTRLDTCIFWQIGEILLWAEEVLNNQSYKAHPLLDTYYTVSSFFMGLNNNINTIKAFYHGTQFFFLNIIWLNLRLGFTGFIWFSEGGTNLT